MAAVVVDVVAGVVDMVAVMVVVTMVLLVLLVQGEKFERRIERLTVRKEGAKLEGGKTSGIRELIAKRAALEFKVGWLRVCVPW